MLTTRIETTSPETTRADVLAVFALEGVKAVPPALKPLDKAMGGMAARAILSGEFEGKTQQVVILHAGAGGPGPARVALIGLGKADRYDRDAIRLAGATLVKAARQVKAARAAALPPPPPKEADSADDAQAFLEGVGLARYEYRRYKTDGDKEMRLAEVALLAVNAAQAKPFERGRARAGVMVDAVNFARDLVNAPSNEVTPGRLAEAARQVAKEGGLECEVLDLEACRKLGMGAYYSVAKGSHEPARFIVLRYRGSRKETVGVVGKGITFDSGGISLKPGKAMWEMKWDMSGAAAVIGTLKGAAALKPGVSVVGVAPCTENMPGGGAQKPGDIWKTLSGKTVEVINTDAEGRLVLSDALTYAERQGARTIVDLATLTGGVRTALGDLYSGIMGNDEKLLDRLIMSGRAVGERYWRFPLDDPYEEYLKSDVADIKNCTEDGKASPIQGGIFLRHFVGKAAWAHLDIAGTAFNERDLPPVGRGATGVGIRTLLHYLTT